MKFKLILTAYELNSTNLLQFQNNKTKLQLSWPNITDISLYSTNAQSISISLVYSYVIYKPIS